MWVRSLTAPKAAHTLYFARITAVEINSAITRGQRGHHLSAAQARAILGHFRRHLVQRYNVLELTPELFAKATSPPEFLEQRTHLPNRRETIVF